MIITMWIRVPAGNRWHAAISKSSRMETFMKMWEGFKETTGFQCPKTSNSGELSLTPSLKWVPTPRKGICGGVLWQKLHSTVSPQHENQENEYPDFHPKLLFPVGQSNQKSERYETHWMSFYMDSTTYKTGQEYALGPILKRNPHITNP